MHDFSYTSPIYDLLMEGGFLKEAIDHSSNIIYDAEVVNNPPASRPMRNITPKNVRPANAPVVSPLSAADNAIVPFNSQLANAADNAIVPYNSQLATTSNDLAKPKLWSRISGAVKRNPKLAAILGGVGFLGGGLGAYSWLKPENKKTFKDPNLTYTIPNYMI